MIAVNQNQIEVNNLTAATLYNLNITTRLEEQNKITEGESTSISATTNSTCTAFFFLHFSSFLET